MTVSFPPSMPPRANYDVDEELIFPLILTDVAESPTATPVIATSDDNWDENADSVSVEPDYGEEIKGSLGKSPTVPIPCWRRWQNDFPLQINVLQVQATKNEAKPQPKEPVPDTEEVDGQQVLTTLSYSEDASPAFEVNLPDLATSLIVHNLIDEHLEDFWTNK